MMKLSWKRLLVCFAVVVAIWTIASNLILAQTAAERRVISGSDLGFRIDSERSGIPTGRFVVRINGQWVEVKEAIGAAKLSQ